MIKRINKGDKLYRDMIVVDIFGGEHKTGFGVVYVCYSPSLDKFLAFKTFQDKYINSESDEYIYSFKKEAEAWIQLDWHPNIVRAGTFELIDNRPFILLEPILPNNEGKQTLGDYIKEGIPDLKILDYSIQFCRGMEHANLKGILAHRDIKPDNIMINLDNILKITDFGLVKILGENK
jgi:serine/threonine protein kinase